jgi:hypothetical protein
MILAVPNQYHYSEYEGLEDTNRFQNIFKSQNLRNAPPFQLTSRYAKDISIHVCVVGKEIT